MNEPATALGDFVTATWTSAVLAALFLVFAARARWLLLPLAVLPFLAAYLLVPDGRVYSTHGMIHTGIVYRVGNGDLPPDNPYFAGVPLQYPWVLHLVVARIARALDVAPSWVFAALNLASLVLIAVLVARISARCEEDGRARPFAVFLAMFAAISVEVTYLVGRYDIPGFWVSLGLPLSRKLSNVNAMPVGIAAFVLGVYCVLGILDAQPVPRRRFALLFAAAVLAALFYPIAWLGLYVAAFPALAASAWLEPSHRKKALWAAATLVLAALAAFPYMRSLTAGRSSEVALGIDLGPRALAAHALQALVMLAPFWILIAWRLPELVARLRRPHWPVRHLVLMVAALLATFAVASFPLGAEYKLEMLAVIFLGVLAAPPLAALARNRWALALPLVALLLVPATFDLWEKVNRRARPIDPYVERGYALEHGDAREAELHRWIESRTPLDAVFVDRRTILPVFARRSVYVAARIENGRNGWSTPSDLWLHHMHGYAAAAIAFRRQVVDAVYGLAAEPSDEEVATELERFRADGRPVYVVARDAEQEEALARRPYLERLAGGDGWAVYGLPATDAP
jgi:hypothetical protein